MPDTSKLLEQMAASQETTNDLLRQILEKQGREVELSEQAARDSATQGRSGPGTVGSGAGPTAKERKKPGLAYRSALGAANFFADASDPFQASGGVTLEQAIAETGGGDSFSSAFTRGVINKGGYKEQLIELKTVEEQARAFGARANDGGIVPSSQAIDARIKRGFKQAERRSRTQELVTERVEDTPENTAAISSAAQLRFIRKSADALEKLGEAIVNRGIKIF